MQSKSKFKVVSYCLLIAIFLIAFPVLSGTLLGVLTATTKNDYQIIGLIIQAIFMIFPILVVVVYFKKKKMKFSMFDIQWKPNKTYLFYLPSIFIYVPLLFGGYSFKGLPYFLGNLFLYASVGIAEELYFRGIIPNILKQVFNKYKVILISTLIFGFGHAAVAFSGSDLSVVFLSILNALLFGWLAIELRYLTNNIVLLMGIHFLFNFQSKFLIVTNTELFYMEIIRGMILFIYAIALYGYMKKEDRQKVSDNS